MNDADTWIDLLNGDLPEADESSIVETTSIRLDSFLDSHERAETEGSKIIDMGLTTSPIGNRTWDDLTESLTSYFGVEGVAYLLSWLSHTDRDRRMSVLQERASVQVLNFVRTIVGVYGLLIRRAMILKAELPDDWENALTYVFKEQFGQSFLLRVELTKYSDDRVVLEGSPKSIMALVNALISMLNAVGDREALDGQGADDFLDRAGELIGILRPGEPPSVPVASAAVAAPAVDIRSGE